MRGARMDINATYVHSSAHRRTSTRFVNFYSKVMSPIVGQDAYAPAAFDAPHRLFVRGQVMPTTRWMLVGTFDWRSGLPYSVVNEDLEFVGPRNQLRFPTYVRTEIGLDRRISVAHAHPWVGVRVANALAPFFQPMCRTSDVAGVRLVLQLRVSAGSHSHALRALTAFRCNLERRA